MNQSRKQDGASKPDESAEAALPAEVADDDEARIAQAGAIPKFVTRLTPLEEQVGVHVITALQHPNTLAVLTTVAADGSGSQQVVSIPLDADRFEQIQKILMSARKEKKRKVQCVGFHCHFEDNEADDDGDDADSDGE